MSSVLIGYEARPDPGRTTDRVKVTAGFLNKNVCLHVGTFENVLEGCDVTTVPG